MCYPKVIQVLLSVGLCWLTVSNAYGDFNWPLGFPDGAVGPGGGGCGSACPGPLNNKGPDGKPHKDCGSVIGCETQTLGEIINLTGVPSSLHYASDRVPGRRANYMLKIRLSSGTLPPVLQRIHLEIAIAGQMFEKTFAPQTNLFDTFTWDGRDVYGRLVRGQQPVQVRIGYEYVSQYITGDARAANYNQFGLPPGGGGAVQILPQSARSTTPPIVLWQNYEDSLGSFGSLGLGGWSLSTHHAYDIRSQTLYLGNGDQRNAKALGTIIATVAGTGDFFSGDDGPATQAGLGRPHGVAAGADGSLYIAVDHRIRRVGPDGIITTVAGGSTYGFAGDGGQATLAKLSSPESVAVGADGSLYIADSENLRIRRVGPDGIINTVAGTGAAIVVGNGGDGGPALQAQMRQPIGIAVGPDGSVYFTESLIPNVRRVGPDGIIATFAGRSGASGFAGDGGLATQALLSAQNGIAVASDGSLYIADTANQRIRRVGPDGIITTVAGTSIGFAGDGGPATQSKFSSPVSVAAGANGNLYIADRFNSRIRRVGADGIITTVAGTGLAGFAGDGGLATQAFLNFPFPATVGVVVGSNGSLYISDNGNLRVRQLRSPLPGASVGDILIAAEDGSEVYVFTSAGRHLRTIEALTGAVRFQFAYDGAGYLSSITDGNGNVTTIARDGSGNPSAIVAPFGQRTNLAVNGAGYLSTVTNPASEAVQLTYNSGNAEGLLATLTDPRGNVHRYFYDAVGRLVRDENPAGGVKMLARNDISDNHYTVTVTTALGLVTTHEVEELSTGDTRRVRIEPSGARTESLIRTDGSRQVTYPDGTVTSLVEGPDPRFGMQAPILKTLTVTKPGGVMTSRSAMRSVTLSDPNNLLSLTGQTDTITTNGQTYTRTYNSATRKVTTTTPAGRQSAAILDALGRVVSEQDDVSSSLSPLQYTYDGLGRITQLAQGVQSWSYSYDAQARLTARTDAAGGSIAYAYDAADRPTQVTLPSGRIYGLSYDASGNRTRVTVPSLGAHVLDYDPVNQEGGYAPPGNSPYVTSHDADARVNNVTLPGGRTETFTYDSGNRPVGISYPEAAVTLSYAAGDPTRRISSYTRTPAAAGSAQQVQFTYGGDLVSSATWTGAAQGQYTYTYDSNFLLSSIALTSGADIVTTPLTRDNDSLLTGLGPFTFARGGPAGAPSQISDGTLSATQGYDTLGRVANRTYTVGGQQQYAVQFSHDNVGRITTKVETIAGVAQTFDYTYDTDGHLSQVQRNSVIVERYTYDANRNRLSRRFGASPAETASYDGQDRLLQQGASAYQFNADGFLTQRGTDTFQYSSTGELLQAVVGGQIVTYAYDGLRRRVSRTDATGTTQYLYGNLDNDLQISNTRAPTGGLTTYYYDDGRRLFALQRGAARYYVATDQLGSPRVITDSAGALVRVLEYDGFGNVTADSNPAFDLPIGFAGGLGDATTGFVRFGLRDYDPIAGRWTARDPAVFNSGQANLYAYVNNNPVNLIDPMGFGSAGVGLCEGVCVGLKIALTKDGISACFELGFGTGNSIEIDPLADLADNGLSTEAKVGLKGGIAKIEVGVDVPVGPCAGFSKSKPKAEICVGPLCAKAGDGRFKDKLSLDEKNGELKNPFKGGGFGLQAKAVGKICQQAKW